MKVSGNSLRVGHVIEHQGRLWVVTKTQHVQPGKGGAYMQAELKSLTSATKLNERFRSSETVDRVYLESLPFQYLYKEGENFVFMDQTTYDQVSLSEEFISEQAVFLKDNMIVDICMHEGNPISLKLPDHVILQIVEAEPVVKGQTAASSFKPAILENGLRVMVPPHIESGTRIIVKTEDHTYVERAKES